jgi:hypothetical protein
VMSDSKDSSLLLYTIPFSHYCELARWSLQRANVPFVERPYLPGLHILPVSQARWEVGGGFASSTPLLVRESSSLFGFFGLGKQMIGADSWSIAQFAEAQHAASTGRPVEEVHAVPVSILVVSSDTLLFALLAKVPETLRRLLDETLGPAARTWVYSYFLAENEQGQRGCGRELAALCEQEVLPSFQRLLWSKARDQIAASMHASMVQDEKYVSDCVAKIDAAVAELDTLVDRLGPWDGAATAAPSITQLAIASVCYPLVFPPQSLSGLYPRNVLRTTDLPPTMQAAVMRYPMRVAWAACANHTHTCGITRVECAQLLCPARHVCRHMRVLPRGCL